LGELTSELRPSQTITEVVSDGPKNNAYRVIDSVTTDSQIIYKIRGITLNYNASKF